MSSHFSDQGKITPAGLAKLTGLLAEARKTKAGLAAAWQVSPTQVSKFFAGNVRRLTASRAVALAHYAGVDLNNLLLLLSSPDDILPAKGKGGLPMRRNGVDGVTLVNSPHARNAGDAAFSSTSGADLVVHQHPTGSGDVLVTVQVRVPASTAGRCTAELLGVAQQHIAVALRVAQPDSDSDATPDMAGA